MTLMEDAGERNKMLCLKFAWTTKVNMWKKGAMRTKCIPLIYGPNIEFKKS